MYPYGYSLRRSSRGHDDQSSPHQQFGSSESAFENNNSSLPGVEPHETRYFQQLGTQPAGHGYCIDNTVFEDDLPQMWSEQQGSMELEQLWDHGEMAPITDHDTSNYGWTASVALNGRQSYGINPSEQSGAPFLMMDNQIVHRGASVVAANSLPNSAMHNVGHSFGAGATFGSQSLQGMGLADHDVVHPNPCMPSPRQFDMDVDMTLLNENPRREPWSTYHTAGAYPVPDVASGPIWHSIPGTTPSTTDHDESGSSYMDELSTPLSSTNNFMFDSAVTERPVPGYPDYTGFSQTSDFFPVVSDSTPSQSLPVRIQNFNTPMVTSSSPPGLPQSSSGRLAVPMQRTSSIRSSTSEASSVGAPPAHTAETIRCGEIECGRAFTGLYRRGNLARHRRINHRKGEPYICEDNTCAREFRRPDARLKHYRKYHHELAAASPFVPRSRPAN